MASNEVSNGPSATSTAPESRKKLRILCLHGYLQNAEVSPSPALTRSINKLSGQNGR